LQPLGSSLSLSPAGLGFFLHERSDASPIAVQRPAQAFRNQMAKHAPVPVIEKYASLDLIETPKTALPPPRHRKRGNRDSPDHWYCGSAIPRQSSVSFAGATLCDAPVFDSENPKPLKQRNRPGQRQKPQAEFAQKHDFYGVVD